MRVVEIGPEYNPIYRCSHSVLEKINSNNSQYIGVDINYSRLKNVQSHGHLTVQGNLENLPLVDGIADEIWLMNILGNGYEPYRRELSYWSEFRELSRITSHEGIVYIGEIYQPTKALKTYDFERFGFKKSIYDGDSYRNFIQKMRFVSAYLAFQKKGAFFLTLTKV